MMNLSAADMQDLILLGIDKNQWNTGLLNQSLVVLTKLVVRHREPAEMGERI
tara:strand:- start:1170 stop:1325 length:156 start_codon:yes stop_codon:yes gene_type:complete